MIRPAPQSYVVASHQPWLDGYCVKKGEVRQFVAMPLGSGYSAEEQITGEAEHGGIQLLVAPLKGEVYEREGLARARFGGGTELLSTGCVQDSLAMGLAPGGRMKQEIFDDPFSLEDWDFENARGCFVHLTNSLVWRAITGQQPPTVPPTAKEYTAAGLPWFEYYAEGEKAVTGSKILNALRSVVAMGKEKGDVSLPENESVTPHQIVELRQSLKKGQVREGSF